MVLPILIQRMGAMWADVPKAKSDLAEREVQILDSRIRSAFCAWFTNVGFLIA